MGVEFGELLEIEKSRLADFILAISLESLITIVLNNPFIILIIILVTILP